MKINNEQAVWSLDELRHADLGQHVAWITTSIQEIVARELNIHRAHRYKTLPDHCETLIVVGGGTLIDHAKIAARADGRTTRLIAVPSIWGSGAEVSPVVIFDVGGEKQFRMDDKFVPDVRVNWPELAASLPHDRARMACGDAWSHALEGFLSPLASHKLRCELATLITNMTELKLSNDPSWFEVSAQACAGQAHSSVGLVHGIAHTLENILRSDSPNDDWHHAKLCSTFLLPVISFNRESSDKWQKLVEEYELNEGHIFEVLKELFDPNAYSKALPNLCKYWDNVLRDPCSRTNSVLVRSTSLKYFQDYVA